MVVFVHSVVFVAPAAAAAARMKINRKNDRKALLTLAYIKSEVLVHPMLFEILNALNKGMNRIFRDTSRKSYLYYYKTPKDTPDSELDTEKTITEFRIKSKCVLSV